MAKDKSGREKKSGEMSKGQRRTGNAKLYQDTIDMAVLVVNRRGLRSLAEYFDSGPVKAYILADYRREVEAMAAELKSIPPG